MSSSLQVAGLSSGFDWKSFVDQMMAVAHAPADRLTEEKTTNTQRLNSLSTLGTKLSALQTATQALSAGGLFGGRSATLSSANSTWTARSATNTATGSYQVAVQQLATAARSRPATTFPG